MERAAILSNGSEISASALQLPVARPAVSSLPEGMLPGEFQWEGSLHEVTERAISHVERVLLEQALRDCQWNKTRAAEKLGVSSKTLLSKMRALGLDT